METLETIIARCNHYKELSDLQRFKIKELEEQNAKFKQTNYQNVFMKPFLNVYRN